MNAETSVAFDTELYNSPLIIEKSVWNFILHLHSWKQASGGTFYEQVEEKIRRIHLGDQGKLFRRALFLRLVRATFPEVQAFRIMSRKKASKGKGGSASPSTTKDNSNKSGKSGLVAGVQANGVVHPSRPSVSSSEFYDVAFKVSNNEIRSSIWEIKLLSTTFCLGHFVLSL